MDKSMLKLKKRYIARKVNPTDQAIVIPIDGDIVILRTSKNICDFFEHGGKTYAIGIKQQPVEVKVGDEIIDATMRKHGFFAEEKKVRTVLPYSDTPQDEEEVSEPVVAPYVVKKVKK